MVSNILYEQNILTYSLRRFFWNSHAHHLDIGTCELVLRFGIQQHPELENNLGLYRTLLQTIQPEDPPKPPNDSTDLPQTRRKRDRLSMSEIPPITEEEHMLLLAKAKELLVQVNPNATSLRKLPVLLTRKARVRILFCLFVFVLILSFDPLFLVGTNKKLLDRLVANCLRLFG
jgi:hypothetical protein